MNGDLDISLSVEKKLSLCQLAIVLSVVLVLDGIATACFCKVAGSFIDLVL
jgi:hypothetical protein